MRFQEILFEKEKSIDVTYRGFALGEFRPDFIVQNEVVVEVKVSVAYCLADVAPPGRTTLMVMLDGYCFE